MQIGIEIHIKGIIDVPDEWDNPKNPLEVLEIADYRYSEQLAVPDVIAELAHKLSRYEEDAEVTFKFSREVNA